MKKIIGTVIFLFSFFFSHAQLTAEFSTTLNTKCDGLDCDYEGPSILINELMISPTSNDGSLFENGNGRQGEWIELYNPDLCEPVDISCFYLGNNARDGGQYGAGLQLPQGTIIPPGGFCMIRGKNAAPVPSHLLVENGGNVVEIVPTADMVCMQGSRLWFPNSGGWFGFYNADGVPQDGVSWGDESDITGVPCISSNGNCATVTGLSNYRYGFPNERKFRVTTTNASSHLGRSIRRMPDGGAWSGTGTPTYATCNDECAEVGATTCDGIAAITVSGGTPPYHYEWDDSQGQLTSVATGLCAGTYNVRVTDNVGTTETFSVEIEDTTVIATLSIDDELCDYGQTVPLADITTTTPTPEANQTGVFSGSGVVGSSFNVGNTGSGTYGITYTYTDENGCTDSAVADLIVRPTPVAAIAGLDPDYCIMDSTIEVSVSPEGGDLTGDGIADTDFDLEEAGVGVHTLNYLVVNQYGCRDSTEFVVTINANPTFDYELTNPNCGEEDGVIEITPNDGNPPYSYSINNNQDTGTNNTFTNLPSGDYGLVVTDANGCVSSEGIHLNVANAITIDDLSIINPSCAGICDGQITATVTSVASSLVYQWYDANDDLVGVTTSPTITGLCAGEHTLIVLESDGGGGIVDTIYFEDFNSGALDWNLNVSLGNEGADPNFFQVNDDEGGVDVGECAVNNNGEATLHLTSVAQFVPGAAYDAGGLCGFLYCPETHRRAVSPEINTIGKTSLTLNFDFIAKGDIPNDQATVWYNDGTDWYPIDTLESEMCGNKGKWTFYTRELPESCENISNLQIAIQWDNNDDGAGADPSVAVNNLYVTSMEPQGEVTTCSATASTTLVDPPYQDPSFDFVSFCYGDENGATNIMTAGGAFSFNPPAPDGATINSATGKIANATPGATYTVEYKTPDGCSASTKNVTVHAIPDATFTPDIVLGEMPLNVNFHNTSSGASTISYLWNFGDGTTTQNNSEIVSHTFASAGQFVTTLTATNQGGCSSSYQVEITVLTPEMTYEYPNIFTPNNDGNNDEFQLMVPKNIGNIEIVILNRWGNVVFESTDINFKWNGKVNNTGAECTEGTYFYKAKMINLSGVEKIEHGFIQLARD